MTTIYNPLHGNIRRVVDSDKEGLMSKSIFGWSYPPGVTSAMIDDQCQDVPCDICGGYPDYSCVCPECPVCHQIGDPFCYDDTFKPSNMQPHPSHGLRLTAAQRLSKAKYDLEDLKEQIQDMRE